MTDSASDRVAQDRDDLTDGDITRALKAALLGQCVNQYSAYVQGGRATARHTHLNGWT